MIWRQEPRWQSLAPSRPLVTHAGASGLAASNSPDAPPATAGLASHCPLRGSNRGSPGDPASVADWPPAGAPDRPGWNNTSAARDCGGRGQTASYNAGICSGWAWASSGGKPSPIKARPLDGKPEENPPAKKTEKRREQEILLNLGKKTEPEENNNFKPANSHHIQTAADTRPPATGWDASGVWKSRPGARGKG